MRDSLDRAKHRAASLKAQPEVKRMPPTQRSQQMSAQVEQQLQQLRAAKEAEDVKARPESKTAPVLTDDSAEKQETVLEPEGEAEGAGGLELLRKLLMETNNPFVNDELKQAVESRCEPVSLDDLLELYEVQQKVEIWPGKLTAVYRTYSHDDYMETLRLIPEDNDRRSTELESVFRLTLSLASINDRALPDYVVQKKYNKDAFNQRVSALTRYPPLFLQVLDVNYLWFHQRLVAAIKDGMLLKNG